MVGRAPLEGAILVRVQVSQLAMKIKILSWNIWCDSYFDKIKEFLASSNADIIGIQEVSFEDPERDIVSFLKNLGYDYVSAPSAEFTDDNNKHHRLNNAVFSKFSIVESKEHFLRIGGKRRSIEAKIQIGETVLSVFSVHLKHTHQQRTELQDEQAETLVSLLPSKLGIVMGDFNATPESYPIQIMEKTYINTDKTLTPTWSAYSEGCHICNPQNIDIRLDYIFVSPDVVFDSPEVCESKGSDHLAISVLVQV